MAKAKEKNISFKVDDDLHTKYRLFCFESRVDMKADLTDHMKKQVAAHERKKAKGK